MQSRTIKLTLAARKHGNLNLSSCGIGFFPKQVFGGPSRDDGIGKQVAICAKGIEGVVKSDIPTNRNSGKPRWIFRERSWVKRFIEANNLCDGDMVVLEKKTDFQYRLFPAKKRDKTITKHKVLKSTYSVVSLFSGCGGLDLGIKGGFKFRKYNLPKTGFDLLLSNDFDQDAVSVLKANSKYFGNSECILGDVKKLNVEDIPDFDVLTAGFPCQPFSNAGKRQGVHDDDGRGMLFYQCERILKAKIEKNNGKSPLAFIFENVRGILSSRMPDGHTVPEEIKLKMKKLGFRTVYKLIKASDYGVPQNRYRVIMVGTRMDLPEFDFCLLDEIVQEYSLPTVTNNEYELCLGSILADIPKDIEDNKIHWQYSPAAKHMISKIGPCIDGQEALEKFRSSVPLEDISSTVKKGRSWKNMKPNDMSPRFRKIFDNPIKYRAPNFYRRFALGEICGTITASGQPENSGITHPFENRRFSVREIARIQSFPDDFVFPHGYIASAYKVIGNAVPPILGWVIAMALRRFLDKNAR